MADYSSIFNPVGTVKKVVELADEESGGRYSNIFKTGAGMAMQGGKVVGSELSRIIAPLDKGRGAYYSSGSRPNQTAESWAHSRLASVILNGPSRKIDKDIWEKYKK